MNFSKNSLFYNESTGMQVISYKLLNLSSFLSSLRCFDSTDILSKWIDRTCEITKIGILELLNVSIFTTASNQKYQLIQKNCLDSNVSALLVMNSIRTKQYNMPRVKFTEDETVAHLFSILKFYSQIEDLSFNNVHPHPRKISHFELFKILLTLLSFPPNVQPVVKAEQHFLLFYLLQIRSIIDVFISIDKDIFGDLVQQGFFVNIDRFGLQPLYYEMTKINSTLYHVAILQHLKEILSIPFELISLVCLFLETNDDNIIMSRFIRNLRFL